LGRPISEELARRGILVKETHETTLRFAPPIVITRDEIDHAVDTLAAVLAER
jgi:ornithine--oxo-acid transaminase